MTTTATDGRNAPRVLLVEDDVDTREALEEVLASTGYDVLAAPNGFEALGLLRGEQSRTRRSGGGVVGVVDVVILDLMMPVMSGWDFRAEQLADPMLSAIPVLLMSAGAHLEAVSDELEAADYITKPVEVPDLLGKVARLVS
jgi:CheY-like chemotaxis protein